ncbi:MAG: aminotransferase class V-fold PLP-dependent enzyme [Salinimicrobium sp.]
MKNFEKQFPVLNRYTYLNTAASGLLSESLLNFRQEHDLDFLILGSVFKEQQGKQLSAIRETVGKFFSCAPNRVALTPNFSYGFNILMEGVEKPKKVLLLENDYPSVNWAVESRNFEVVYAKIDERLEQNIADVVEREKPDVFCFSIVQYLNGIKIDLEFLKQLKKRFPGLLLFADGTQYCGTEHFDFEDSAIDVLGASAYKWMNAGYGNAFFLFREHMENKIFPKSLGFNSLQGKYKPQEGSLIGKFEPGHQDTLNFGSLKAAIEQINRVGMGNIEKEIKRLSEAAKQSLGALGLLEDVVMKRGNHSSIFNIKGDQKLFEKLRSKDVICSQRANGIRLSFHFYNSEEDLEKLLKILKTS